MLNRRQFSSTLAVAAAGGLTLPPRALARWAQEATLFDWRVINPDIRVAFGAGGNAMVVRSGGGSLLVDTKLAGYGQVLRAEAEAFGGPLERVVNTHHHGDHVGGNPTFTGDVSVVAQTLCARRAATSAEGTIAAIREDPVGRLESMTNRVRGMEAPGAALNEGAKSVADFIASVADMNAMAFAATNTFLEELQLRVGDTVVELRHIDNGHTDNDVFVRLPGANVIHCGDLFFNGMHPFIDVSADATTVGWQRNLAAMIDVCDADTMVIPGHGELSDVDGLRAFSQYFDTLREIVRKAIQDGRTRNEVTEMNPTAFDGMPPRRLQDNLGIVYDELTKQ